MKHLAIKSANCNQVYKPRGPVLLMPKFDHTVKLYKTGTIKNITEKILYINWQHKKPNIQNFAQIYIKRYV